MAEASAKKIKRDRLNVVMCGLRSSGEYTTGYVHSGASKSDKKIGVIGLCMFELRRLGHIGEIACVGTTGSKFPGIREHFKKNISDVYNQLDVSMKTYPADDVARNALACELENAHHTADQDTDVFLIDREAIDTLKAGDICTIFTPDNTHFDIAKYAIELMSRAQHKIHVLVTKPAVMTLAEHQELVRLADTHHVLVMVEFHKRWDPIYTDARNRARTLGDFSYFSSYMSQPKFQLETFKAWAGKSSDISYYLNSHHIDMHAWQMEGRGRPIRVSASAATGIASGEPYNCPKGAEDTITLLVTWENTASGNHGTAVYTSSWAAAKGDVHSQQRFHYMGHKGELAADQAHRGYTATTDAAGFGNVNPLYMSYLPGPEGHFNGHHGYGYRSIEAFVEACEQVNAKSKSLEELHTLLPTLKATEVVTVILEAGRRSLDQAGQAIGITHSPEQGYSFV